MNNKFIIFAVSAFWIMVILMLRQCSSGGGNSENKVVYQTTSDTTYITKDTTIFKKGDDIIIHDTDTIVRPGDTVFVADSNYAALKKQYEDLVALFKVRNIYIDSFPIDSFGNVFVTDTLQYNELSARTYYLDYAIPQITIKEVSEPRHLFYMGGGLSLAEKKIRQVQVGVLYKPFKKNVFGIHLGAGVDGTIYYGGSAYWLLNKGNKQIK